MRKRSSVPRRWNDDWVNFFKRYPNAKKEQILDNVRWLELSYGLIDSRGYRRIGAPVAATDKLSYTEWRSLDDAGRKRLTKARGGTTWDASRAEKDRVYTAYKERQALKEMTGKVGTTAANADEGFGLPFSQSGKKKKIVIGLGALGTALGTAATAEAASNIDDEKLEQDLNTAKGYLLQAYKDDKEGLFAGKIASYDQFKNKIKEILVDHFGLDPLAANLMFKLLRDASVDSLIPEPWK